MNGCRTILASAWLPAWMSGMLLALAPMASAVTFDYAVIANMTTTVPSSSGTFTSFLFPSISDENIALRGDGSGGQTGTYVAFQRHLREADTTGDWDTASNWIFDALPRRVVETEIQTPVSNTAGVIFARDAILRFQQGLHNDAALAASFGTTDVVGDVTNSESGLITVAGNSQATF